MNQQTHIPSPAEQPEPGSEPPPPHKRPKRKRSAPPGFSPRLFRNGQAARVAIAVVVLALGLGLRAQNVPTPSTNPTGQQQATTPQPVTPQQGWMMFDDGVANELRMPPEQLQQLRGVDERYLNDYRALGEDPTMNPRYQELTDRRNAEIRQVMGEPLYDTWMKTYPPVPNTIQEQRGGGISTPPPPTP